METKELILQVSFDLFAGKGFNGVTIKDIIQAAGLTKGGFYHYFESKQQLFEVILEQYIHYLDELLLEKIKSLTLKPLDKIAAVYKIYGELVDETLEYEQKDKLSCGFFLIAFDGIKYCETFRNQMERFYRNFTLLIENILSEGKRTGDFSKEIDCKQEASEIVSILEGSYLMIIIKSNTNVKDYYTEMKDNKIRSLVRTD